MRIRMTLFVLVLVGAMLLVAPAAMAAITVTSIAPSSGQAGTTVQCTVRGTFHAPVGFLVFSPKFVLDWSCVPRHTGHDGRRLGHVDVGEGLVRVAGRCPRRLVRAQGEPGVGFFPTDTDHATLAHAFQVRPTISSLSPSSVVAGAPELTLQVNGGNFVANSSVRWNGAAVATTFNSATRLTAIIPAVKLTALGTAEVTVMNVTAGTTSAPAIFTITGQVPVLTSLSPTSVWAGYVKDDVVLTVNGSGFLAGARILLSGGEKAGTTFANASQLTVPLMAADISTPTTLTVSVKNPPFPPGVSSALALLLPVVAETTDPVVTIGGADSAWHKTPVALTFSATDSQSGVQKVQYQSPPTVAAWTDGAAYTVPVTTQGAIIVSAQALDWCNRVGAASVTVNIDTTKPETAALGNVSVKKGKTAKLKYRVTEPAGLSPSAKVVIKIKRGNGTTAKTFTINSAPVNSLRTYGFKCNLAKGSYKWYVYATDLAGNTQDNVARATLTVK